MNLTGISKYMSKILRHAPELIGIDIEYYGAWADTQELIKGIARTKEKNFNMEILEKIVANDEKQRYSFNEDKSKVTANQGHSIDVDMGFEAKMPPEILFHGTPETNRESIDRLGLLKQGRNYVHLSNDKQSARKVGGRHGKPFVYKVLTGQMYRDGYKFYCSDNGVWLTDEVPPQYLKYLY